MTKLVRDLLAACCERLPGTPTSLSTGSIRMATGEDTLFEPLSTAGGTDAAPRPNRVWMAGLCAIVAIGLAMRFYQLGAQSLWVDEINQTRIAGLVDSAGFGVVAEHDNVAPLSHWMLGAWIQAGGTSETWVRMPSVLAGGLTIVLMFVLGRQLFSSRVGLLAAAITACSPLNVWYSQDARMYALLMCFSVGIMLAFWQATTGRGTWRAWLALTVVTVLGVYTHQFSALLSIGCGIYLVYRVGVRSRMWWYWFVSQAVAALFYVPWLVHSAQFVRNPAGVPKPGQLLWVPYNVFTFLFGFSFGPSVRQLHEDASLAALQPYLFVLLPLVLATAWLGLAGIREGLRFEHRAAGQFCVVCLVSPILLTLLATTFAAINYNVRYTLAAYPAFVLLLSLGVLRVWKSPAGIASVAAVATVVLMSLGSLYHDGRYSKEDYRGAAKFLRSHINPSDVCVVSSSSAWVPLNFYDARLPGNTMVVNSATLPKSLEAIGTLSPNETNRVWLIEIRSWEADREHLLRRALDDNASLESVHAWPGVALRSYTVKR